MLTIISILNGSFLKIDQKKIQSFSLKIYLCFCSKVVFFNRLIPTIALAGAGVGINSVFSALILAFSRNPGLEKQLFAYAILGFALTEAIALFGLMMAFLILFGFY